MQPGDYTGDRLVAYWLLSVCALIFAMVVLGGVTRLTGSGLSMVHWQPVTGVVPPMSETQWDAAFKAYQAYPEYQRVHPQMDLDGFKSIFWLEYFHRLLGRAIGFAFLLGFVYFLVRRRISRRQIWTFGSLFVLGALQGLMGWVMVKSGLVDEPHVSPYRLTAHLALALVIYGVMLWTALGLLGFGVEDGETGPRRFARWMIGIVGGTILSGGFVAGLKAGFVYNTFPKMDGHWIPDVIYTRAHWWDNWFADAATVQFNHRVLAISTLVLVLVLAWRSVAMQSRSRVRVLAAIVAVGVVVQVGLGVSTLLLHVPIPLAASHQGGAVILLSAIIALTRDLHGRANAHRPMR